jgi:hypothetical protein
MRADNQSNKAVLFRVAFYARGMVLRVAGFAGIYRDKEG